MTLSEFVRQQSDAVMDEWEAFARTCLPAAKSLSSSELRDHGAVMLHAFAADMESEQSSAAKDDKSRGLLPHNAPELTAAAHQHALQRFSQGFSLNQMISEYRALRASVTRRWMDEWRDDTTHCMNELVRYEESVDQAVAESVTVHLEQVENSRALLLGMLGHDLRNPLGAVRMSAEYLLRAGGLNGSQTMAVTRIANSATSMKRMVEELLDFTQTMLVRALPLKLELSNLGEICSNVVDELVAFHPGRAVHFHRVGDLSGHWDSGRVGQLLSNLASNAIQHGAVREPVCVTVRGEIDAVVVEVHNKGKPIPPDARSTLFLPSPASNSRRAADGQGSSGLGLGLYIAHEIVVAHGGSIDMESTESAGTTFTVRLPRSPHVATPAS